MKRLIEIVSKTTKHGEFFGRVRLKSFSGSYFVYNSPDMGVVIRKEQPMCAPPCWYDNPWDSENGGYWVTSIPPQWIPCPNELREYLGWEE